MDLQVKSAMGLTTAGTEAKHRCDFFYGSLDDASLPPVYPSSDCYNSREKSSYSNVLQVLSCWRSKEKEEEEEEKGGGWWGRIIMRCWWQW